MAPTFLDCMDQHGLCGRVTASMKVHSVVLPDSSSCGLPNGQATAKDAARGLPFSRLRATAGSSTAIHGLEWSAVDLQRGETTRVYAL